MSRRTTPTAIEQDIRRSIRSTAALRRDLDELLKEVLEARDAGLVSLRSKLGTLGGTGVGNPTEASAASLEFRRLQDVMRFVSRRVERVDKHLAAARSHVRQARGEEEADARQKHQVRDVGGILGAWLDIDPEEGPARRERRAAARELTRAKEPEADGVLRCPTCGTAQPVVVSQTTTTTP